MVNKGISFKPVHVSTLKMDQLIQALNAAVWASRTAHRFESLEATCAFAISSLTVGHLQNYNFMMEKV